MRVRVAGVIIKDDKILLMRRVKNGREYFVFPGGAVEKGESPKDALVREIKEELSLDAKPDKLLLEMVNTDYQQKEYYYLVKDFRGEVALGGEEKENMNKDNQYYPRWFDLTKAFQLANLYPESARVNIHSKLTKDQVIEVLKIIDQRIGDRCPWMVIAGTNLYLRGLKDTVSDIDIVTNESGLEVFDSGLKEFKISKRKDAKFRGYIANFFRINHLELEVFYDFAVTKYLKYLEQEAYDRIQFDGLSVRLLKLEKEAEAYTMMGRIEKAEFIRQIIKQPKV